jgi:hypothetical protein
MFYEIDN